MRTRELSVDFCKISELNDSAKDDLNVKSRNAIIIELKAVRVKIVRI